MLKIGARNLSVDNTLQPNSTAPDSNGTSKYSPLENRQDTFESIVKHHVNYCIFETAVNNCSYVGHRHAAENDYRVHAADYNVPLVLKGFKYCMRHFRRTGFIMSISL